MSYLLSGLARAVGFGKDSRSPPTMEPQQPHPGLSSVLDNDEDMKIDSDGNQDLAQSLAGSSELLTGCCAVTKRIGLTLRRHARLPLPMTPVRVL